MTESNSLRTKVINNLKISKTEPIKMIEKHKLIYQRKAYVANVDSRKHPKLIAKKYITAGKIYRCAKDKRLSPIQAQYHLMMKPLKHHTVLVETVLYHEEEINYLMKKFDVQDHYTNSSPDTLKMLIADWLWLKHILPVNSYLKIQYYEADLLESVTEAAKIFNKLEDSPALILPVYVRINTLKISIEDSINRFLDEGWKLLPKSKKYADYLKLVSKLSENKFVRDFHISELLVFPSDTAFYTHPGYLSGKFLIQDKGSCLSSFLLNPKPGSRVLDMCAAPGQKTNHLANIINNEGIIFACDNHPDRYNALCKMMRSTGVKCVETIYDDCTKLQQTGINYILVDIPCSYSGIFDHKERKTSLVRRLERSYSRASNKLRYALQNFAGVKRVVFTSCSKFSEEAERVVDDAVTEVGSAYTILDAKEMLWNEWGTNFDTEEYPCRSKCLRIKPKVDFCQGYFIAVFERNPEVPVPRYKYRKEHAEYDDEFESEDTDDEDSEVRIKNNSSGHNRSSLKVESSMASKIYKRPYYKPYDKDFNKSKPQSSTSARQSDNYHTGFVRETTHNQLYP